MKLKRFLACMLAMVLVLSLLPASALAETLATTVTTYEEIPFWVNPLYEGLVSEEDFVFEERSAEEEGISHDQPTFNNARATYVSPKEAGVQLRGYMKNRVTDVDLYIRYETTGYEEALAEALEVAVAHTGNPTEGDYLLWHFAGWGGGANIQSLGGYIGIHVELQIQYYSSAEQEKALDTAVNRMIQELDLSGKSDYEKVCAVYTYICQNITYDYENLNNGNYTLKYSAYAALMDKTAVCQGYANLLYRVLLKLGIDNRIITGETLEGAHAWNIVKLGDVYYNVDATWDAILGDYSYFLRNSDGFFDHFRYLDYATTQFHTDYPMSATNYVDSVAGEPEHVYVWGTCGEDAYWTIDRDRVLTIFGTGAAERNEQSTNVTPWGPWNDGFDSVVVEEGITRIGDYLFSGNTNIVSVQLPESLTEIGECAFRKCESLKQIRIPATVTGLEHSTFQYCYSLESVELNEGLEWIGGYAFDSCTALKSIQFPESLVTLHSACFDKCTSLTEVTIPATISSANGFRDCSSLETVYIHTESISAYAFSGCTNLKNVYLYDTVTYVDNVAFSGCNNLETITIPASVTRFGMSRCAGLKTIYFLGDAPEFDYYAFYYTTPTVYYPADNPTWTEEVRQNYEGTITWVPYTPGEPMGLLGDVSGDGYVDTYDAALIAMYDALLIDESGLDLTVADVSGDGFVDTYDAALIAMYDALLIDKFPAE